MFKKRLFLVITAFWLISYSHLYPVVILVHGTIPPHQQVLPQTGQWWKPGSEFYKALELNAHKRGHTVVPFSWRGVPASVEIEEAGILLAKLISSYPVSEHIEIVAHSHGGNVAAKAMQELYKPFAKIAMAIAPTSVEIFIEQSFARYEAARQHTLVGLVNNIPAHYVNSFDLISTLRASIILGDYGNDSMAQPVSHGVRRHIVDAVYCLGTPIDEKNFYIPTELVGSWFNIYSNGDAIQRVAGLYGRQLTQRGKIANIELFIRPQGCEKIAKPGHSDMHHALVGEWVLRLPETFLSAKFDWQKHGVAAVLLLDWERCPICLV